MSRLRLDRLPERTPVKVTVALAPELNQALVDYAGIYEATYGVAEPVTELIPAMLWSFLNSDREFARGRQRKKERP